MTIMIGDNPLTDVENGTYNYGLTFVSPEDIMLFFRRNGWF